MAPFQITLTILILACFLLGFGFQFRKESWGIGIMWVGALVMLSVIAYKIYEVTNFVH